MSDQQPTTNLRIGVAGLGTVGAGLLKLIQRQDELRLPGRIEVTAVSARNRNRNRNRNLDKMFFGRRR